MQQDGKTLAPLHPLSQAILRWSRPSRGVDLHLLAAAHRPVAMLELDGDRGHARTSSGEWRLEPDGQGGVCFIDLATGDLGIHLGRATWRGTRVATAADGERYAWEPADWLHRSWRFRRDGETVVEFRGERAFCQDRAVVVTGDAGTGADLLVLLALAGRVAGLRYRADSDAVAAVGAWTAGG